MSEQEQEKEDNSDEEKSRPLTVRFAQSRFEEFVERREAAGFGSNSAAIRAAVIEKFFGNEMPERRETVRQQEQVDLEPVVSRLDEMQNDIDGIQRRLGTALDTTDDSTKQLAQQISNNLPIVTDDVEEELMSPDVSNYIGDTGAFRHIDQRLLPNSTKAEIRKALSYLKNENDQVESTEIEGYERYYKLEA